MASPRNWISENKSAPPEQSLAIGSDDGSDGFLIAIERDWTPEEEVKAKRKYVDII